MTQNPTDRSKVAVSETIPITSPAIPDWLIDGMPAVHTDFNQRIVLLPEHARWRKTPVDGVEVRIMEYVPGDHPRVSAQLRFTPVPGTAHLDGLANIEIFVQRGMIKSNDANHSQGEYLRLPYSENPSGQPLFNSVSFEGTPHSALIYLASGHMLKSDAETRSIDTTDKSRWLPGPADNTQVLPLHGHGTGNVMLIRWDGSVAFKPRLDPRGEEVLVLHGALHDAKGYYPAGSWIRNPIVAWQSWGAKAGTMIYYKNGHFDNSWT
ncbi:MAG: cupin domain-containing protein [Granulosicoccus sp.]|nr:cupin domain-containing protein [Granulosicoccus sp.]